MMLALAVIGHPLAHHRRFAEASRSRQQREFALQASIKPCQQAWACEQGGMQPGQMEFRGKHWRVVFR